MALRLDSKQNIVREFLEALRGSRGLVRGWPGAVVYGILAERFDLLYLNLSSEETRMLSQCSRNTRLFQGTDNAADFDFILICALTNVNATFDIISQSASKLKPAGILSVLTRNQTALNRQQENYLVYENILNEPTSHDGFDFSAIEKRLRISGLRGIRELQSSADSDFVSASDNTRYQANCIERLRSAVKRNPDQAELIMDAIEKIQKAGIQPTGITLVYGITKRGSVSDAARMDRCGNRKRDGKFTASLHDLIEQLRDCELEEIHAVYLDEEDRIREVVQLAQGAVNSAKLDISEALKPAVMLSCKKIILIHNHPSGRCMPSVEDIHFSRAVSAAAAALGISLVDHIIVGASETASALH